MLWFSRKCKKRKTVDCNYGNRNVNCEIYDMKNNFICKINCDSVNIFEENYSGDFCHSVAYIIIDGHAVMRINYIIGPTKVIEEGNVKLKMDV